MNDERCRVRRAVVAGCAVGIGVGWPIANIGAVPPELAEAYGVGLPVIGLFTTALFLAHLLMQVPGGRLSDRIGARRVALLGLALVAAGHAIALIAPEPAIAVVGRVVAGMGLGFGFIAGSDYVRSAGGSPFAQGLYGGIGIGAGGVALIAVPPLTDWLGWRAPFLSAIVAAAVAAVLLLTGPRDRPRRAGAMRSTVPVRRLARDRTLHRMAMLQVASFGLGIVASNWVTTLLQHHGFSSRSAGAVSGLTLLGGVVARPAGGWVRQLRPGWTWPMLAGSVVLGAAGAALLVATSPLPVAILGALAIGLAAGLPMAPLFTGAALARPDAPATAVALVNGMGSVAVVALTPLIGLTFDLPGDGRIGFAIIAVLWATASLWLPTRRQLGLDAGVQPAHETEAVPADRYR